MGLLTKYFKKQPKLIHIKNFFTTKECEMIVKDFKINDKKIKLSSDHGVSRISSYEIDIKHFSKEIQNLITKRTEEKMLTITGGNIMNIWGVRYNTETKSYMDMHYDCNQYSTVVTLNDGFVGGGTYFPLCGKTYKTKVGDGYMIEANRINSYHDAREVTKGTRYVLVLRTDKRPVFLQILDSLFLHFVDRYINKRKDKLYKNPTTNYLR